MPDKTILLVEDDDDSRQIYGMIVQHAGYRLLEARDGNEGIEIARRHKPDLVLMDMGLPGVDGWAATRAIRSDPDLADIPIYAVTIHATEEDRERAEAAGCNLFFPKPCTPLQLVREISRAFPSPSPDQLQS